MSAPTAAPVVRAASRVQRAGAVATGVALAGAAVTVAAFDPSSPTSRFPGCVFHLTTGLWCPGCGLTRGTHALLRGHPLTALGENVFTPLVLAAIALTWFTWAARTFGRPVRNPVERLPRWSGPLLIVAIVVYGVLRNLPVAPFDALAP